MLPKVVKVSPVAPAVALARSSIDTTKSLSEADDGNASLVPAVICPEPPDNVTTNCLLTAKLVSVILELEAVFNVLMFL